MSTSYLVCRYLVLVLFLVSVTRPSAAAQQVPTAAPSLDALCTVTVPPPAAAPAGGRAGRAGGAGGRGIGAPAQPAAAGDLPRLVKVRDDVYVIQNVNDTVAEIGTFGGNVTIYLTDEGVVLIDSKNERMHDDIVAKVKSLTDKPIKYVVLTHHHQDHSGGAARMRQIGATTIISRDDRQQMARANQPGLPQAAYFRHGSVFLGGKEVQLIEYCGLHEGTLSPIYPRLE